MSFISLVMVMIMIFTFYHEYNKEKALDAIQKSFLTFIKEPNIRKILGLNSLFIIILMNLPLYYIWIYFRKNNFFPYEFFEYEYIIKSIGIENIFISLVVILYFFLPYLLKYIREQEKYTKYVLKITIILIYIIFFLLFIEGLYNNFNAVAAYLLFFISIGIQVFLRTRNYSIQIKYWWGSIISIFILIALPFYFNQGLVKRTLFNNHIGNFEVLLINQKQEKNYCLLLKSNTSYYLQDDKTLEVIIASSENNDIKYKITKKYCEIKK